EVHVAQIVLARLTHAGALERFELDLVDLMLDLHADGRVDGAELAERLVVVDDVLDRVEPLDRWEYWHDGLLLLLGLCLDEGPQARVQSFFALYRSPLQPREILPQGMAAHLIIDLQSFADAVLTAAEEDSERLADGVVLLVVGHHHRLALVEIALELLAAVVAVHQCVLQVRDAVGDVAR